ncbi:UNVERIFIED_CONTAM: protein tesmin/TSO1-like CXC 3 [Sesamum radiatum]|uniref:Protein tesmin/TSO1-like CXC 3 n=1 Tax=Sesamum radiatum TaxID=300843 RepID=A0AAW2KYN3_SESRA
MDSPKSCKPTTTTAAETAPAQDSPVFSYISNLSPIQPVKAPPVTQGFPGLNSPPLVFTSPRLNPHSHPTFLKSHRKDASKAWLHSGKYFQSPESNLTFVAPYMMSPGSPRNSENNGMISGNTPGILDLVSPDQGLYYGNAEMENEYSTVSDQSGKMENLSRVPNAKEWASQSFSGNKSYSSVSSLRLRGSPNTPTAQFSGHKTLQVIELESDFSNSLQDDTPDILKDSPTPLNAVKVSSPNKKRVSPPHGRQHEFSSSSSDGLRTGRKFILKAVPSFPPLTPCTDSKSVVAEQKNDPQSCNQNK